MIELLKAVQTYWNLAVPGTTADGKVNYVYIPYPPAMFPVAAVLPVQVEEDENEAAEGYDALWRDGRTA